MTLNASKSTPGGAASSVVPRRQEASA